MGMAKEAAPTAAPSTAALVLALGPRMKALGFLYLA